MERGVAEQQQAASNPAPPVIINLIASPPAAKTKNVLKERFILKNNTTHTPFKIKEEDYEPKPAKMSPPSSGATLPLNLTNQMPTANLETCEKAIIPPSVKLDFSGAANKIPAESAFVSHVPPNQNAAESDGNGGLAEEAPAANENAATTPNSKLDETADEKHETMSDSPEAPDLCELEALHLRQCRNKAYSKLLEKKRLHLTVSLASLLLKEWQTVYPKSRLTARQLMTAYELLTKTGHEDGGVRRPGRKRKYPGSGELQQHQEAKINNGIAARPESEAYRLTSCDAPAAESAAGPVISLANHSDRQWSPAMLSNLHYCAHRASLTRSDLETQWKLLYPNSVLTARNLKSRFTVYERTHTGISVPAGPVLEEEADQSSPVPAKVRRSLSGPSLPFSCSNLPQPPKKAKSELPASSGKAKGPVSWTEEMIENMFSTREQAKQQLQSEVNSVVNTLWHQLWIAKYPEFSFLTKGNLYSRYIYHSKKRQLLGSQPAEESHFEIPASSSVDTNSVGEEGSLQPTQIVSVDEAAKEAGKGESESKWTDDKLRQLFKLKTFVEDRLRCIQDEYFFELLYQKWRERFPLSTETLEDVKDVITDGGRLLLATSAEEAEGETEKTEARAVERERLAHAWETEYPHTAVEEKLLPASSNDTREATGGEVAKEEREPGSLPRDKWICPQHYIHVFYDDQDKSHECILTDQLLQMRQSLVPRFPGQDIFKPGKKPAGFARLLLSEWKRHYPATQENTKTISMKIGRYDRAPQLLAQGTKTTTGKINWTPNMIEQIRTTRERAEAALGAGVGSAELTLRWRAEWEAAYPEVEWKQVLSRYQYHFGAERRDSQDSDRQPPAAPRSRGLSTEDEDIRGFRQWNASMQEDLLILRDLIYEEHPEIEPDSKEFSQKLLAAFQQRHPSCLESARSLLSKLRDPLSATPEDDDLPQAKRARYSGRKSAPVSPPQPATPPPPTNPALLQSKIEGFDDWNLGMVRDFISCMDRARRKYAERKAADPELKLVPLLLWEWQQLYPESQETVRSFLVRIRFLKSNKEVIKLTLGHHDLLPNMSQDPAKESPPVESPTLDKNGHEENQTPEKESRTPSKDQTTPSKFVWDSRTMMPDVIATRAKAIAVQAREEAAGRRVSYSKIWIKEFLRLHPNCPYTSNNLSVHYWYWNSRENGGGGGGSAEKGKTAVATADEQHRDYQQHIEGEQFWSTAKLRELERLIARVEQKVGGGDVAEKVGAEWARRYPTCREEGPALLHRIGRQPAASGSKQEEGWSPQLNKKLRELVCSLLEAGRYTRSCLLTRWCHAHSWPHLAARLQDCGLPLPSKATTPDVEQPGLPALENLVVQANSTRSSESDSCLNSRGQMRWSAPVVQHLLAAHQAAVAAKSRAPSSKLAQLLHAEFLRRYPSCPVSANVLLTKCYIFRSDIKSGKLILASSDGGSDDISAAAATSAAVNGTTGVSRTWTSAMLAELEPARQRALDKKRQLGPNCAAVGLGDFWLGEFRVRFPAYRGSKKQLLKQYRRLKAEQGGAEVLEISNQTYEEVKAILESRQVLLPPFVSSRVIMRAQQWVEQVAQQQLSQMEGSRTTVDEAAATQLLPSFEPTPLSVLPGGAVVISRRGVGHENGRPAAADAPDVSIFPAPAAAAVVIPPFAAAVPVIPPSAADAVVIPPSAAAADGIPPPAAAATVISPSAAAAVVSSSTAAAVGPLPAVLAKLSEIGLPLACLPTALAVYREVRDSYKAFVLSDLVVSWPGLLTARWEETGLPSLSSVVSLESLVATVLEGATGSRPLVKAVLKPTPPILCDKELVAEVVAIGKQWCSDLCRGWEVVREKGLAISLRQFVSILAMLGIKHKGKSAEELIYECELLDAASMLRQTGRHQLPDPFPVSGSRQRAFPRVGNVSLDRVGYWLRQTCRLPGPGVGRRKRPVLRKNPRLYWSNQRLAALELAEKRAMMKWSRLAKFHRWTNSLLPLLAREYRRLESCTLGDSDILARLLLLKDRERRQVTRAENRRILHINKEYLGHLDSETVVSTVAEEEAAVNMKEKQKHHEEEDDQLPDYTQQEEVIKYIRDRERAKKQGHQVWSSKAMVALLKARSKAQRRRQEWEEWAVRKHGSLQAACSNPRVKVPKFEELLVEEWSSLQPNQAGISAWTLNSYIRKFESLQEELIRSQAEQTRRRKEAAAESVTAVCWTRSSIPKYDLSKLAQLTGLSTQLRQLITTRQAAKEEEEAGRGCGLSYLVLWAEQYRRLHPSWAGTGHQLQARLYQLQCRPSNRAALRSAQLLLPATHEEEDRRQQEELQLDFEEENPRVTPRLSIIPDLDPYQLKWAALIPELEEGWKVAAVSYRRAVVEGLARGGLGLPVVRVGLNRAANRRRQGLMLPPKCRQLAVAETSAPSRLCPLTNSRHTFACSSCAAEFHNLTNQQHHMALHKQHHVLQHQQQHVALKCLHGVRRVGETPAHGGIIVPSWGDGYLDHRQALKSANAAQLCRQLVEELLQSVADSMCPIQWHLNS